MICGRPECKYEIPHQPKTEIMLGYQKYMKVNYQARYELDPRQIQKIEKINYISISSNYLQEFSFKIACCNQILK